MTDTQSGYGILHVGSSSVLVHTSNSWRAAGNITPPAVPTGGGMTLAVGPGELAVGIDAFERLRTSPILRSRDGGRTWVPSELPGPLSGARHAISFAGTEITAVLADARGTLVAQTPQGWRTVTDAGRLSTDPSLIIDSVVWAGPDLGWLTGRGAGGSPVAFQTTDGGTDWSPIGAEVGAASVALAPCGTGRSWQLPVISADHSLRVIHTSDQGATWSVGAPVKVGSAAASWGCRDAQSWLVDANGHLQVSDDDGASWKDAGSTPHGITDLAPGETGRGFAVSDGSAKGVPAVFDVASAGRFTPVALPAWVNTLAREQGPTS